MSRAFAIHRHAPLRLAALFVATAAWSGDATAAPAGDFPLEQSARSGVICRAVRDYEDPAAQLRGAKAWAVHCRGWEVTLGHLYTFERDGTAAVGEASLWHSEITKRATCGAFEVSTLAGLAGITRSDCKSIPGGIAYPVYVYVGGTTSSVAEGLAPLSDVIESGLKIVAGVTSPPPLSDQVQAGRVNFAESSSEAIGFVEAANAAQETADFLSDRAYFENHGWMFTNAERDTLALTRSEALSPNNRALAQLNFALNVSNQGRFEEADIRFAEAMATVEGVHDSQIQGVAFNDQALHYLNQRRPVEATRAAQRGVETRAAILHSVQSVEANVALTSSNTGIEISPVLAASLNERRTGIGFGEGLTLAERLSIQDAQSYYVIGLAAMQSRQAGEARAALSRAEELLAGERVASAAVWLRVRVFSGLASLDISEQNAVAARDRLMQAIQMLRTQAYLQATPAEADLYLDLAHAEAVSNMIEEALRDYKIGFQMLLQSRGSFGDSIDDAAGYFDLLLELTQAHPEKARQYATDFFDAAAIAVSPATAQTVTRLAARVADMGNSGGVLERALEDLKREITVKTANARRQQGSSTSTAEMKAAAGEELAALDTQQKALLYQLVQSNPGYGKLLDDTQTMETLQKALAPGEIYVKTMLLAARGYAIAITPQVARIYAFPLSRTEAEHAVEKLRAPFVSDDRLPFDVQASHDLFTKVFGPVQDEVRGARHLIYEPDRALISFPAAAFIVDAASVDTYKEREPRYTSEEDIGRYQGLAWLGRNTEISLSVSPAAFLRVRNIMRSAATRPFLGLGDPKDATNVADPRIFSLLVDGRDPVRARGCEQSRAQMARRGIEVPGMAELIRAVGQRYNAGPNDLMVASNFTDAAILNRTDLTNYRIVFFGTHGLLPNTYDCLPEPALVTSIGPGNSDAFLDASEILRIKLDAELIVLAACDTGGQGAANPDRTGLTGSGEALGGLARDFIYAGGRSLLVSQWSVDQAATLELMGDILQPGVSSQGHALRRAETMLMDMPRFSHPYFWAAFSLVGDGTRPM